ncbi:MAG TPA: ATP-binding protein [Polyangiaceae bacterium]
MPSEPPDPLIRLLSERLSERPPEPVVVEAKGERVILEGHSVGDFVIVRSENVSERRALEEELRRLRRVESLSLLTASVIHDFNNLMTPMLALSSSLAAELRTSSRTRELVSDIESLASRTASLFRDIVRVTKPSPRQSEDFDLCDVVAEMRPLLERVAGDGVELVLRVEGCDARVSTERSRLEHALLNLVANARHAMPKGGTVTLWVSRAPNRDSNGGGTIELVVSDTGEGMNEDVLLRACDDFFTTRGESGGTGLGLASIKRFVTESGGSIALDSAPGRGTTVSIRLPEAAS